MQKLAVLTLITSLILPGSAFAIGAIAIDSQYGEDEPAYGFAIGAASKENAFKIAMKYCKQYGGSNCKPVVWFETCGAVATSKKYYGYGYGRTKAVATAKALEMCARNSCKIVVSECE